MWRACIRHNRASRRLDGELAPIKAAAPSIGRRFKRKESTSQPRKGGGRRSRLASIGGCDALKALVEPVVETHVMLSRQIAMPIDQMRGRFTPNSDILLPDKSPVAKATPRPTCAGAAACRYRTS